MGTTANGACSKPTSVTTRKYGIVVADDDENVRSVFDIGMRRQGFDLCLAPDGPKAIDLYQRHCEAIDVVLLDGSMAGWDGPQALAALLDSPSSRPIPPEEVLVVDARSHLTPAEMVQRKYQHLLNGSSPAIRPLWLVVPEH